MLEIFIDKQEKQEKVALVENGNLVEYYEEDENSQTIAKETIAPTVGVSTGKGPELKAEIYTNVDSTASTEDVMEYKITVRNDGEVAAENAKVTVNLPEW